MLPELSFCCKLSWQIAVGVHEEFPIVIVQSEQRHVGHVTCGLGTRPYEDRVSLAKEVLVLTTFTDKREIKHNKTKLLNNPEM